MLEIKGLYAGYDSLEVLRNVDMVVNDNEIVAVIGPNGAGKSTVIKSVFSIADVNKGKIIFNGNDITGLKTHELMKTGICYVPQGRINFGNLTVEENLRIIVEGKEDKKVVRERLEKVYKQFPILRIRKKQLAFGLSGGQQQMLAIGRALMHKPKLLMLDEPSLGLSPKLQKELFAIIKGLKDEGISILLVEQNAKKAVETADRTYILENGIVALEGDKDILNDEKVKKIYVG